MGVAPITTSIVSGEVLRDRWGVAPSAVKGRMGEGEADPDDVDDERLSGLLLVTSLSSADTVTSGTDVSCSSWNEA